jgi:hypothetical protein
MPFDFLNKNVRKSTINEEAKMKRIIYFLGSIPLILVVYFLFAREPQALKIEVMQDQIPGSELKVGDITYIPINNLTPGQLRYAQPVVQTKVAGQKKIGLIHDDSKSTLAKTEKDAVPVIKAPFGLVIKDKHHETLAAIRVGAQTVPVHIVDDLSNLTTEEFWQKAEEKGHVYPYNLKGERQIPTSFADLQDDPNRQFATIISRKCINVGDPVDKILKDGAEYPVWIKILSGDKKTRAFIEFIIADTLYKHGILYTYDIEKTKPEKYERLVEQARKVLLEDPVLGIKVIPEKIRYTEIHDLCS